ncbi:MAG TPA: thiol reductant ABC exporter subunit CydD [Anaerolineales bacterium]
MHRRLLKLALPWRLPLAITMVCGVLAGLCSLAQAYTFSSTVDGVFLDHQGLARVWPWLRLLLVVILLRGILLWLQEISANEVAIRVKGGLREKFVERLLALGPGYAQGERTGELTSTAINGIEALDAYFTQFVPQLIISTLVPFTILIVVMALDPLSGFIMLVTAPLIPFFMFMIGRTAETATQRQYETLGMLSSHFLDSLQGLTTLKIFGQAAAQVRNVAAMADRFRDLTLKVLQLSFLSAFALELLSTISTAIIAVEVGVRLLYGQMEFRSALFLLVLAPEFYLPLRMLGARFHSGMAGTAAARRIFQVLDTPAQTRSVACPSTPGFPERPARGGETVVSSAGNSPVFGLQGITFTYPGGDRPALEGIDLSIQRGERIAIVGASGAGKSTLASLLLGFIRQSEGHILLDGRPLESIPEIELRKTIGWVPQSPHVFHGTLADNLRLGRREASDEDVALAARLAHFDEFIRSLPEGLSAMVGEGGSRLSSGEAQRLALARAYLTAAPILILDEPTSSLDPENEAMIEESLSLLHTGRTVITIAHRLNTVRHADRILVLDRGRVVEQGKHAELAARNGTYAALLKAGVVGARSPSTPGSENGLLRGSTLSSLQLSAARPGAALSAPHEDPRGPERQVLSLLFSFLRGSWGKVALSLLLGSLTVGSSVALMGTSSWLISAAALQPSIASLEIAIVGVRFFGISRAVFRYLERLASHGVTFQLIRNIRVWFYSRLEPLAPARLMDYGAGDLMARAIADVETLENLYVRVLAPPLTAVLVAAGTTLFLYLNNLPLVAVSYLGLYGLAGFGVPLSALYFGRRPGSRMVTDRATLHSQMVDSIQGIADLIAFGRTDEQLARLRTSDLSLASDQRKIVRVAALHSGMTSVLTNIALWIALVFAIPTATASRLDGIMLASVALVVLASFEGSSGLQLAGQLWPATQAAARRQIEVVSVLPAVLNSAPVEAPPAPESGTGGFEAGARHLPALTLVDVSFTYPGRLEPALKRVSLHLEPGRSMAIVGPSGAGKSTIARLLLRFWEFDAGEISLGGASIRASHPDDIRSQIGFVSQNPYIFDTSVFENLRLARRGVSGAEVEQAARRAQIHDRIMELPRGYHTWIGEHGARLSAGERQRLGIARLILRNAPFMLLDEPTANLDATTEAAVLATLFDLMRSKTSLWITHRLIGMERLDKIIVINHGAILEHGPHEVLLAAGGFYARLWKFQNLR